jgi:hypothetical protein
MNEHSGVTLSQLIPDGSVMEDVLRAELSKDRAVVWTGNVWALIGSQAMDAIRSRLNFDVVELLGHGWTVARQLHEYKDPAKHPANETTILNLGEHSTKTECHPLLTLTVGQMRTLKIRFTLELTAKIHSVALSIRNAHITAIGTGSCSVSAQLKYGKIDLHNPVKSPKFELPGKHDFAAPGLKIL